MRPFQYFTLIAVGAILISTSTAWGTSSWAERPTWQKDSDTTNNEYVGTSHRPTIRDIHSDISPFSPGSNNVSIDVGQVFLMGDLSSHYNDAIGSQLHYTYGVSEMFGFDTSLGYSNHSDGDFSMTTLLTGVRMNLAWYDKVIPHLDFGLGFYKPSYALTSETTLSPVLFGLHLGPGIDLELTKQFFFGASLVFHDIFGSRQSTPVGDRDVGGTYTSFFLRAGFTF